MKTDYAFGLQEITSMQLACIKQLTDLKKSILDNRLTRGRNIKASTMESNGDVVADIDAEIAQRKLWAMDPSLVRI